MDDRMQKALAQAMKETKNKEFANKLQQDMKEEAERRQQREAEQRAREEQERIEREAREAQRQRQERLDREKSFEAYLLRHNGPNQNGNFINPYTFFPLEDAEPERKKPKRFYGDGGLTGKLTCELTIVDGSPLFIPNTTKAFSSTEVGARGQDSEADHRWFDFFSYDDLKETKWREEWPSEREPIIPGSSLRGMARSVYEQLTNSCYSQIDEKNYPNKRTNYPKKPYLMKWNGSGSVGHWNLYRLDETEDVLHVGPPHGEGAETFGIAGAYTEYAVANWGIQDHAHNDDPALKRKYLTNNGAIRPYRDIDGNIVGEPLQEGESLYVFHPTGPMKKKQLTLFRLSNDVALIRNIPSKDALERFGRVVDDYCNESVNKHKETRKGYKVYRTRYHKHKPIFVYADDSLEYLSPACMTREHFKKTISKLLEEHAPCAGDKLCPACRLFGTVNKETSIGSRLRFSDGTPKPGVTPKFDSWTTLPALSSPKISATEFYLKRPADNCGEPEEWKPYWNYDYCAFSREIPREGRRSRWEFKKGDNPDKYTARPNGRKVYLHHPMNLGVHYGGTLLDKKKTNDTVHPLKQGAFTFDVYFEDVSKEELANLVFALGGTDEGRLQKLGHGKPLGMGSVNVKVTEISKRVYTSDFVANDDSLDLAKVIGWLPADADAVARRRLIEHLAQDLSDFPQTAGGNAAQANMGQLVHYPAPAPGSVTDKEVVDTGRQDDNGDPIREQNLPFNWFKRNRGESVQAPYIKQTLHVPSLEDWVTLMSEKLERAVETAEYAHEGQKRKGTDIDYITHPLEVEKIVEGCGASEDACIAALFHDILEDVPAERYSEQRMREEYGDRVVEIVKGLSEPKQAGGPRKPWKERKDAYLQHLAATDDEDVLVVCAGDKIANLESMLTDYEKVGEELWNRFNAGKEQQRWYYEQVLRILSGKLSGEGRAAGELVARLRSAVAKLRDIV